MNSVQTVGGIVSIGDSVLFQYVTGQKTGKVTSISEGINSIQLHVYYTDSTGGYTLSVPHYHVIKNLTSTSEEVEKPKRYNKVGKLECWDVIIDQEMNFLEGNIIKYVWRYKEKNGVEDLKKAKVYLEKLISELGKK